MGILGTRMGICLFLKVACLKVFDGTENKCVGQKRKDHYNITACGWHVACYFQFPHSLAAEFLHARTFKTCSANCPLQPAELCSTHGFCAAS